MKKTEIGLGQEVKSGSLDHSTNKEFLEYYAQASQSKETLERFISIQQAIFRILHQRKPPIQQDLKLDVADVGCGAGTQCLLWARLGHHVHGVDISQDLVQLGKNRAQEEQCLIDFQVGSATALPWDNESMDVCLVPELLEHVADWSSCLKEFSRVLRPGGVLFLSTTNKLCPVQQEFNLPLYSWYPGRLKRYYEQLAVTTRPQLVNFAKYPAVTWFSYYSLNSVLKDLGFSSLDRFDVMDLSNKSPLEKMLVQSIRMFPPLRFLGQVLTPYTVIFGIKR